MTNHTSQIIVSQNHKMDLNKSLVYKLRPSHYAKQKEADLSKMKSYVDDTMGTEEDEIELKSKINIYESKPTNALIYR